LLLLFHPFSSCCRSAAACTLLVQLHASRPAACSCADAPPLRLAQRSALGFAAGGTGKKKKAAADAAACKEAAADEERSDRHAWRHELQGARAYALLMGRTDLPPAEASRAMGMLARGATQQTQAKAAAAAATQAAAAEGGAGCGSPLRQVSSACSVALVTLCHCMLAS
jgi:hypothetical protein